MSINLALHIKPQTNPEGVEWAERIRASQLPCRVTTERHGHDSVEHHLVFRSASLKILQHNRVVEGCTINDASPEQIAIVNILMTAGLLQSMAINGATSVDLPSFEPEERSRRFWVLGVQPGDLVRVPYSLAPEDVVETTVDMIRGGWLYLVPRGSSASAENYVKACAVNGWTVPFGIKLVPPASTVSAGGRNAAL